MKSLSDYLYYHEDNPSIDLYCGDCLEILPYIEKESIDLVVTSPPYNIGIDYGIYKDNLKWPDYLSWCKQWFREISRILKPDGRFALNILTNINSLGIREQPFLDFGNIIRSIGLNIHGISFWCDATRIKYTAWGSWCSASAPYIYTPYEVIIIGYKKQWKKNKRGKDTISKEKFLEGVKGHYNFGTAKHTLIPSTFPLKLPLLFVELLSFENDIILDPFLGSGTTLVACQELNRRGIGIEINKKYCDMIIQRLKNTTLQLL